MLRPGIVSSLLSFNGYGSEHAALRPRWAEVGAILRRLGLHAGARPGSVSSAWLRQHDIENDKRGDHQ
jgi:hypothetical protein